MVGNGFDDEKLIGPQGMNRGQQTRMDHMDSFNSTPLSVDEHAESIDEYADTISARLQLDEQIRVQGNLSSPHIENRSISALVSSMSIDTMWNVDWRDTGNSSAIPLRCEDRLQWFKQFFAIGVKETLTKPQQGSRGRGWRVMVRIVCACRKLSKLLRAISR